MAKIILVFILLISINSFTDQKITIALQPFNGFDTTLIAPVKAGIAQLYGPVEFIVLPARPMPRQAWYKPRKSHGAEIH